MTKRTRSWIQVAEISFLCRMAGLERVKSSDIRWEIAVEPLLLCVKRRQLRLFGHLIWMPPGRFKGHDQLVGMPGDLVGGDRGCGREGRLDQLADFLIGIET